MEREDLNRKKLWRKAGILSEENNELEQNNEDSTHLSTLEKKCTLWTMRMGPGMWG